VSGLAEVRFEDGFAKWFDGSKGYALSLDGWQVLNVAAEALNQRGVRSEDDPAVRSYLERNMPPGLAHGLSSSDVGQLRELGYGFALGGY